MQSMENDEAVYHPSHSRLEDAGEARVSHIPTTTATDACSVLVVRYPGSDSGDIEEMQMVYC